MVQRPKPNPYPHCPNCGKRLYRVSTRERPQVKYICRDLNCQIEFTPKKARTLKAS